MVVKIYCPSCGSYYVGIVMPRSDDKVTVMKCQQCGDTWKNINREDASSIGMLTEIMKDTFGE